MTDYMAQDSIQTTGTYMYRLENLPAFADVEDLRWRTLVGSDGERIGTIESIERDESTDRVEFLQIGRGGFLGFGAERFLVPVTAILRVDEKQIYVDRPVQMIDGVPAYDHERIHDPDYCAVVRAWWCPPGDEALRSES